MTPEDLRRSSYGGRTVTRLAAKIDGGSMEQFLPTPGDKKKMLNWIQDGSSEEQFARIVSPILEQNCWRCHNPQGFMHSRPLQIFDQVQRVTVIDRGEPVPVWTRVAHTHLQSLALIFFGLGALFAMTALHRRIKLPGLVLPLRSGVRRFWRAIPGPLPPLAGLRRNGYGGAGRGLLRHHGGHDSLRSDPSQKDRRVKQGKAAGLDSAVDYRQDGRSF